MKSSRDSLILIVGAGPVGLCAGIALLKDGLRVTLVDSGSPGAGWASGGMLAPLYEMAADPAYSENFVQFALESARLWQEFAAESGINLQSPTLFLARTEIEVEVLESLAQRAAKLGLEVIPTDIPQNMQARMAISAPSERALEPRAALKSLVAQFCALGGELVLGQAVSLAPHRLSLVDGRTLTAQAIVLAHGFGAAGMKQFVPALQTLSPVKGQMVRVAHMQLENPVVRAGRLYFLSRSNGLVIGATSDPQAPPETDVDLDPILALLAEAKALLPPVAKAAVIESWAGLRPDTSDHLPLVGHSGVEGVYLATGTYRNGWLLAPAIGTYLSQLISGKTSDSVLMKLLAPARFTS